MAAASSPSGPPNCSSNNDPRTGFGSATRTVYWRRLLWMNMGEFLLTGETPPPWAGTRLSSQQGIVGGVPVQPRRHDKVSVDFQDRRCAGAARDPGRHGYLSL